MSKPNGGAAPPKIKIPLDSGMSVNVWENWRDFPNGGRKKVYSITLQTRRYQDRDGEWKSAPGFSPTEAAAMLWAIQKALDAISTLQAQDQTEELPE